MKRWTANTSFLSLKGSQSCEKHSSMSKNDTGKWGQWFSMSTECWWPKDQMICSSPVRNSYMIHNYTSLIQIHCDQITCPTFRVLYIEWLDAIYLYKKNFTWQRLVPLHNDDASKDFNIVLFIRYMWCIFVWPSYNVSKSNILDKCLYLI